MRMPPAPCSIGSTISAATSCVPFDRRSSRGQRALRDLRRLVALERVGEGKNGNLAHHVAEQIEEAEPRPSDMAPSVSP